MESSVSAAYVYGKAFAIGAITLLGVFLMLRRTPTFRTRGYWWWFMGLVCNAALQPIGYMWMQDFHISYEDAALLRILRAGSWHVASAYAMILAVIFARGIDVLASRR